MERTDNAGKKEGRNDNNFGWNGRTITRQPFWKKEGRKDSNSHAVAFNDNKNSAKCDDSAQAKRLSSKRRRARWPSVENDDAAVMSDDSAETLNAKAMPPKAKIPSKRTMPPQRAKRASTQNKPIKMRKYMKQQPSMSLKQNEKTWPNKTNTNITKTNETKHKEKTFENKNKTCMGKEPTSFIEPTAFIHLTSDTSDCIFLNSILFEQPELADCFLEYPRFDNQGRVPFHFETIQQYQADDQELQGALQQGIYQVKRFGSTDLICRRNSDKIVLSDALLPRLVQWYHLSSVHMQGMDRLEGTIQQHFYHPGLRKEIRRQLSPCVPCQLNRRHGQQFGALAPREAISIPWQEVHLDTIGPWKLRVNKIDIEFKALTAIDPVTNLLEIALLNKPYRSGSLSSI
jgi:hypothetical protein